MQRRTGSRRRPEDLKVVGALQAGEELLLPRLDEAQVGMRIHEPGIMHRPPQSSSSATSRRPAGPGRAEHGGLVSHGDDPAVPAQHGSLFPAGKRALRRARPRADRCRRGVKIRALRKSATAISIPRPCRGAAGPAPGKGRSPTASGIVGRRPREPPPAPDRRSPISATSIPRRAASSRTASNASCTGVTR